MKKMIFTIFTMAIISIVLLTMTGCETRPTEYDHKAKGWELWAGGQVDKANIIMHGTVRTFVVEFEGDLKVEGDDFYNFNDIVEGTNGSIYRWNTGVGSVFMWVPTEGSTSVRKSVVVKRLIEALSPPPELEKALASRIEADAATKKPTPAKHEWHSAIHQPPDADQTVVLEFEDGLLTVGYYTRTKEYKTDVNRRKMSGGIALKNVVRWKSINLE